ncbi:MAG TPA: DUF1990 family protein [Kofleriaceae bacterium]|nr:DUF1990 family protein [Kofleriaceae bacterium]
MDILVFGAPHLDRWDNRAFSATVAGPTDRHDTYERDVADEPPGEPISRGPQRRVGAAILRYSIFPPEIVEAILRRPIEVGDTVGVHYRRFRVVRLFFAARVTEVFDGPDGEWWRTGFTYRTLVGHPELGEETFSSEKQLATGRVRVALRSWSRPGTWLARWFAPIVRRMQVGASLHALDHLESIAKADGSAASSSMRRFV